MQLILLRHAHKGLTPAADPELSTPGFKQAQKLVEIIEQKRLPPPNKCWVSEKIRTKQTIEAASQKFKSTIEASDLVNLRSFNETAEEFQQRIKKMISMLNSTAQDSRTASHAHYLCTHYDWIEDALVFIPSPTDLTSFEFSSWAPAQYIHFEIINSIWTVRAKGAIPI